MAVRLEIFHHLNNGSFRVKLPCTLENTSLEITNSQFLIYFVTLKHVLLVAQKKLSVFITLSYSNAILSCHIGQVRICMLNLPSLQALYLNAKSLHLTTL